MDERERRQSAHQKHVDWSSGVKTAIRLSKSLIIAEGVNAKDSHPYLNFAVHWQEY